MAKEPRLPEIERGTEVFAVDPLTIRSHFEVDYVHSYKQDTPFFHGLQKGKLLGSLCAKCNYRYATPRAHCMYCGGKTEWFALPLEGRVHSYTVCYFAAQEFLDALDVARLGQLGEDRDARDLVGGHHRAPDRGRFGGPAAGLRPPPAPA